MALKTITVFGHKVTVHEALVPRLRAVEKVWLDRGGHSAYRITSVGGFANRNIAGTNTKSHHASGIAIDINPAKNPMGKKLVTDMPDWFVAAFKSQGFGWGGDWKSKKDAMHFSLAKNEGGVGIGGPESRAVEEHDHSVGDGQVEMVVSEDDVRSVFSLLMGREPSQDELSRYANLAYKDNGQAEMFQTISQEPEAEALKVAKLATRVTDEMKSR